MSNRVVHHVQTGDIEVEQDRTDSEAEADKQASAVRKSVKPKVES